MSNNCFAQLSVKLKIIGKILNLSLYIIRGLCFAVCRVVLLERSNSAKCVCSCLKIDNRPVFVIGHPRTGTTHMFNLLSLNKQYFDNCTTFMVGFPLSFIWFEKYRSLLGDSILSKKRPMDNMALGWDLPQEDELATNVLTSGLSPYMCVLSQKGKYGLFSIVNNNTFPV